MGMAVPPPPHKRFLATPLFVDDSILRRQLYGVDRAFVDAFLQYRDVMITRVVRAQVDAAAVCFLAEFARVRVTTGVHQHVALQVSALSAGKQHNRAVFKGEAYCHRWDIIPDPW